MREARTAARIEPASGKRAKILEALSKAAFEAIKIIELERSGIRDGDGYWDGSDVIGRMTDDLTNLCRRLREEGAAETFDAIHSVGRLERARQQKGEEVDAPF